MSKFNWVTHSNYNEDTSRNEITCCELETDSYIGCVEYVGVDMFGNSMWYATLIDKVRNKLLPVSEFGLPFNSMESAKEAILRAIDKEGSR